LFYSQTLFVHDAQVVLRVLFQSGGIRAALLFCFDYDVLAYHFV
jgi:hypothetical protein